MITANVDGNTDDELLIEFGYAGLWLYDNGAMNLLSEEDTQTMAAGDVVHGVVCMYTRLPVNSSNPFRWSMVAEALNS